MPVKRWLTEKIQRQTKHNIKIPSVHFHGRFAMEREDLVSHFALAIFIFFIFDTSMCFFAETEKGFNFDLLKSESKVKAYC